MDVYVHITVSAYAGINIIVYIAFSVPLWPVKLTCFLQRITAHLHTHKTPPYVINLDPAVHEVPFPANIGEYVDQETFSLL